MSCDFKDGLRCDLFRNLMKFNDALLKTNSIPTELKNELIDVNFFGCYNEHEKSQFLRSVFLPHFGVSPNLDINSFSHYIKENKIKIFVDFRVLEEEHVLGSLLKNDPLFFEKLFDCLPPDVRIYRNFMNVIKFLLNVGHHNNFLNDTTFQNLKMALFFDKFFERDCYEFLEFFCRFKSFSFTEQEKSVLLKDLLDREEFAMLKFIPPDTKLQVRSSPSSSTAEIINYIACCGSIDHFRILIQTGWLNFDDLKQVLHLETQKNYLHACSTHFKYHRDTRLGQLYKPTVNSFNAQSFYQYLEKVWSDRPFPTSPKTSSKDFRDFRDWNNEQVIQWVQTIEKGELAKYAEIFKEKKVIGSDLEFIRGDFLKEIGITSVGHQMLFEMNMKNLSKP
jgi:hypothetical protein